MAHLRLDRAECLPTHTQYNHMISIGIPYESVLLVGHGLLYSMFVRSVYALLHQLFIILHRLGRL